MAAACSSPSWVSASASALTSCPCAFDLPSTGTATPTPPPPVVRYVWAASYPGECRGTGFHFLTPGSLAYLGDGNFCVAWAMGIEHNEDRMPTRFALLLVAVQVVLVRRSNQRLELCLVKRKVRCYNMPTNGRDACVLHPALPPS
ncbi:hypothetical protein E2562_025637 [Oryza meyeriana var. granulata]|uniref:Uncharacterized protein n=1 Tax=Oryza meyeriana var. granulata TaxID=110450 RepID=A0A6G1FCM2_9ORYZ|nr:hypothetical protein E2562_025637 [Oryza meyeriana var. granulata]